MRKKDWIDYGMSDDKYDIGARCAYIVHEPNPEHLNRMYRAGLSLVSVSPVLERRGKWLFIYSYSPHVMTTKQLHNLGLTFEPGETSDQKEP